MRFSLMLASISVTTLLLSPNGRAEKREELAARQAISQRVDVQTLSAKAYAGNAQAQFSLGLLYEKGHGGVKRDLAYALSWYEEAARNGFKAATDRLSRFQHADSK